MSKVWLASYPQGVPESIGQSAQNYASLTSLLNEALRRHATQEAYQCLGSALRYQEVDEAANQLAGWLQAQGVKRQDRIAIVLPNILQYPIAILATLRLGAIIVNTNPMYSAHELQRQLNDAQATTVIIAENFAHTLEKIIHNTEVKRTVVTGIGDMMGGLKGKFTNFYLRHIKRAIPAWTITNAVSWHEIFSQPITFDASQGQCERDDIACLQYTGGTTGVPKGTILTHGNLIANLLQAHAWVQPTLAKDQPDIIITALPLYHIFAFTANFLLFTYLGAKSILIPDPRDMKAFVKDIKLIPFTAITGVNTLFNGLLRNKDFQKLDFSALRWSLGGGMAIQEAVARRWLEITGKPIAQAYGLTETSPAVSINPLDATEFTGSIGLPVPSTEVVFRDSGSMENKAINEAGELCVRGPQVTPGYWQRPEETADSFDSDGFFRTGDIGYMDQNGYIYLLDRQKDMILVSGFNVYPNEVEGAAVEHEAIIDAAAIGIPDEHSGEAVRLFVMSKDPTLSEAAVIAHCRERLTAYKVPKEVIFMDDLPRNQVGKVLRRKLKKD